MSGQPIEDSAFVVAAGMYQRGRRGPGTASAAWNRR